VAADQIEAIFIHPHLIAEWRSGCHGLPVKTGLTPHPRQGRLFRDQATDYPPNSDRLIAATRPVASILTLARS
jgi:hypothetical protein